MLDINKIYIIDKIIFLEKYIGEKVSKSIIEPFYVPPNDIISIQNAAKKICEFLGLQNMIFIVTIAKQSYQTAGHVELNNSHTIFIELDSDVANNSESILHVLSHEITHKYLHYNGIKAQQGKIYEQENEILTDLTAIYIGLGKLILNGSEYKSEQVIYDKNNMKTQTSIHKYGYLSREKYEYAYLLVCRMRNIPFELCKLGLKYISGDSLKLYEQNYEDKYLTKSLSSSSKKMEINERTNNIIKKSQMALMELEKRLNLLRMFTDDRLLFLENSHKFIKDFMNNAKTFIEKNKDNPNINFLSGAKFNEEHKNLDDKLIDIKIDTERMFKKIEELINLLYNYFEKNQKINYLSKVKIVCHNCGYSKTLNDSINEKFIRCPECDYEFFYDSTPPIILRHNNNTKSKDNKGNIWKKNYKAIKNFFR